MINYRAALLAATSVLGMSAIDAASANSAPVYTGPTTVSFSENSAATVMKPTATDADGDKLTISINGGVDSAFFKLDSKGFLRFIKAPDFEKPLDFQNNNSYRVRFKVSDGGKAVYPSILVKVTNVDDGGTTPPPTGTSFKVKRVASGLSQPLFLLGRGDGTNRVFIVEKGGQIEILNLSNGLLNKTPFLDISSTIKKTGEFGLLGMALAPDFKTSGVFYVNATNISGDTEIRRYKLKSGVVDQADPASVDVILKIAQPGLSHKAGWLGFGPDNLLYIATGDGDAPNDPLDNGQNKNTLLGKILRIDPSRDAFPANNLKDYAIPAGNAFTSGGAPEIYAWGLRNPWRSSFDKTTGNLYVGDVGEKAREEINLIRKGEKGLNFGWAIREGTIANKGTTTAGLTPPIIELPWGTGATQGRSITGGYVYRGAAKPLQGQYIFGDFITGNIWSVPATSIVQGKTIASSALTIRTTQFKPDLGVIDSLASFGEDDKNNLFMVGIDGEIFQIVAQ
jgi:hypothetical protein